MPGRGWCGHEEHRHRQPLHQGAARGIRREKGAFDPGDRPLTRGLDQEIYALTDVIGRPYALTLRAGNISDVKAAPAVLERAGRMRYLPGDTGYQVDRLRRLAREVGATPLIPGRRNHKRAIRYDQQRYRGRHLIANAFCRLKDFRRIATR